MNRIRRAGPVMALALAAACAGGSSAPREVVRSPGPSLVVERFLQAANAHDLLTMMQLFGTAEGTIDELDGRSKAERRMHVLATLLRHDDFMIVSQQPLPGRLESAAEVNLRLRKGNQTFLVPHIVVRRNSGGWIVEQVDVEALTANRTPGQGSRR